MKLPKAPEKTKEAVIISPEQLEEGIADDMSGILTAFKERAQDENARLLDATDSEFWFAVCFQTREQKEEFLKKMGLLDIGDKYLDGLKVAAKLGIKLESPVPPARKIVKFGGAYLNRIIK